jgi:hypothetical protein
MMLIIGDHIMRKYKFIHHHYLNWLDMIDALMIQYTKLYFYNYIYYYIHI